MVQQVLHAKGATVKIDSKTAAALEHGLPEGVRITYDEHGQAFLTGRLEIIEELLGQEHMQDVSGIDDPASLVADVLDNTNPDNAPPVNRGHNFEQFQIQSVLLAQDEQFGKMTEMTLPHSPADLLGASGTAIRFADVPQYVSKGPAGPPPIPVIDLTQDVPYSLHALQWYSNPLSTTVIVSFSIDDGPLPAWMSYDPLTGLLTGAPGNDDVGHHTLRITYTEGTAVTTVVLNVAVQNVNDAPTTPVDIDSAVNAIAENAVAGSTVGITARATDIDVGTVLHYSLIDNAGGRFTINSLTGVVTVANGNLLNYEANTSHTITVRASDGQLYADQTFTINVLDVNEAPVAYNATFGVAENTASGTILGQLISADEDAGDTASWSIVSGNGSGLFALSASGALTLAGSPDYEAGHSYSLVVRVTDSGGLSSTSTITINISDVNEAPVAANATFSVAENTGIGTLLGYATATDVDAGDTQNWSIVSGNGAGLFALSSSGKLTLAVSPDYEVSHSYTLVVRVTDSGGLTSDSTITINITDVNEAPVAQSATFSVLENTNAGTFLGNLISTDQDAGDTASWSIVSGNGSGLFALSSSGQLTLAGSPDYETGSSYNLVVRVTDSGGLTSDTTITINIIDVNEAPVAADATFSVAENTVAGTLLGYATATDDAGDTAHWTIISGNDSGLFSLSSSGALTLSGSPDYESGHSYSLVVRVTDSGGLTSDSTITINILDVNEAPVAADAAFTVAENTGIGALLGALSATDVDANDTQSWSIVSGNGSGLFALSSSGQLTLAGSPDYEAGHSYSLVVRVTDSGGLTSDSTITITITDVNDAPVAYDATFSVEENTIAGAILGQVVSTDQDAGDTATWSIVSGNNSGLFSLSASGQLTLAGSPDFETHSSYTLTVRVTDSGGLTSDSTITINILDVNEAPVAADATFSVAENTISGTLLGALSATDVDAHDTQSWSIVSGNGSGLFALSSSGQLTLAGSPDYEAGHSYSLVVRVTDSGGLTSDSTITINILDVNEAPVAVNATFSVAENTGSGAVLGQIISTDQDANDTATWSIVSGNNAGVFALSASGQLTLAASPDYEVSHSYTLVVRVTDSGGLASDSTVTINILDVNEAPTAHNETYAVAENTIAGAVLGTIGYSDPDANDTATWSIVSGNNAGIFALSASGQLTLAVSPDYEVSHSYSLVVRVTDSGGLTSDSTITINITDVNEAPVAQNSVFSIAENTASGAVVGQTISTDQDVGDTAKWHIVSGNESGMFALSESGQIVLSASPDYEVSHSYTLVVRVTDSGGLISDSTITINIIDVNEAPTAYNGNFKMPENADPGLVVGVVHATDPDAGDTMSWNILSGNDTGLFTISPAGELVLVGTPDVSGTIYHLVVQVTDSGGLTSNANVTVNVGNVNHAPVAQDATFSVNENTAIGVVVGIAPVIDPDADDTATWSIVSGNGSGMFSVSDSGQITLAKSPDFETGASYSLVLRVVDGGGLSSTSTITININDVNEAPVTQDATYSVAENTMAGTVVGVLAYSDVDANETASWTITSGNDSGMFTVSSTGQILLAQSPDFETAASYNLTVRVTDKGGLFSEAHVVVNITDVNEAPVTQDVTYSVAENTLAGAVLGSVPYSDPDHVDTQSWVIVSGNDDGMFTVSSTGQILLAKSPDFETTPSYNLTVRVTDKGGLFSESHVVVNITDVNEAPVTQDATYSVAENTSAGTVVGVLAYSDVDANETATWTITSGNDSGMFTVSSTGQILLAQSPDFETAASYNLTVRVTDKGGLFSEAHVVVNITDVNEAPVTQDVTYSVAENTSAGTVVGVLAYSDVDANETASWTITSGNDSGMFTVSSTGQILLAQSPDFETAASYNLTVRVTDKGGLFSEAHVVVNITDVNEAPVTQDVTYSVAENTLAGAVLGSVPYSDPDHVDTQSWVIVSGNDDGMFTVSSTGQILLAKSPDFETTPSYNLTVRVTDKGGLFSESHVVVNITDVNEAPVLQNATFSVAENTAADVALGFVPYYDPDHVDTQSWSFLSGNDDGMFKISQTGEILLAKSPDFETTSSYTLVVQVVDKGGLISSATITVNITDVNEAPLAHDAVFSINENSAIGDPVGLMSATDPDAIDTKTWRIISGNDDGMFNLLPNGQLKIAVSPDYEAKYIYHLVVEVTDKGGLTSQSNITININDVNEAPTAISETFTVAENTTAGTVLGILSATDPDANDTAKWSIISGNDSGVFALSDEGSLSIAIPPDYETTLNHSFTLTVRVTDSGGLTSESTITINITDVNEAPVAHSATYSIDENSAAGTILGALSSTDQDINDTATWSIVSGNNNGIFKLSPEGILSLAGSPDYEADHVYHLVVQVKDSGNLTSQTTITININDLNDAPIAQNATYSIAENTIAGAVLGTLIYSDQDVGDTATWKIMSGNDAGLFVLSLDGTLTLSGSPDYEATLTHSYTLTVRVTDHDGLYSDSTVTINITDVNEAPVASNAVYSIAENSPKDTLVGSAHAYDQDIGDTQSWSIISGNEDGIFTMSSDGQITILVPPNYETLSLYTLVVRVVDGGGLYDDSTITINITDVNEAPTAYNASFSVNENTSAGTILGTLNATDPDHIDTQSWQILSGNDSGMFILSSSGELKLGASPDYELKDSYSLTVRVTDKGGLYSDSTITITINDVNEAPVAANATFTVVDGTQAGTVLGDLVASDPDIHDTKSWQIVSGDNDNLFTLSPSGQLTLTGTPDYGLGNHSYTLTVRVTDSGGLTSEAVIKVNIGMGNSAPVVLDQVFELAENSTAGTLLSLAGSGNTIHAVVGTDADGDPLTWTIVAGNGAGNFVIDSVTGELSVAPGSHLLDYEGLNTYTLTVTADDGTGNVTSATITINLTDVNEAPVTNDVSFTIYGGTSGGATLKVLTVTDPDAGDTHTWSIISGNNNGVFAIDNTGRLTVVKAANSFGDTSYALVVQTMDSHGLTDTATINVHVNATDTAPLMSFSTLGTMYGDKPSPITGISFSDPELGQDISLSISMQYGKISIDTNVVGGLTSANISGNGTAHIVITGATIEQMNTTFATNGVVWNMVTPNAGELLTMVLSDGVLSSNYSAPFAVTFSNTPPVADGTIPVQDIIVGQAWNYHFSENVFHDTPGDVLTYTATLLDGSPLPGLISFDPIAHTFSVPPLGPEYMGIYQIKLIATDQGGLSASQTIQLNVTNIGSSNSSHGGGGDDRLHGSEGNDVIYGGAGNDVIYGEGGNDTLYGDGGNDTLYGGAGSNILYGGSGADTFMFQASTAFTGVDTIMDFSKLEGDKINIADLLQAFNPVQDAINNFVSIRNSGGNTILSVDMDGPAGAYISHDIATINGQTWASVEDMITSGHLIVTG